MPSLRTVPVVIALALLGTPAAASAADLTVGSGATTATRADDPGVTTFTGPGTVDRTELLAAIHVGDVRLVAPTVDLGGDLEQSTGTGGLEIAGTLDVATDTLVAVPGALDLGPVAASGTPEVQLVASYGALHTDGVTGAASVVLAGPSIAVEGPVTTAGTLTTYSTGTVSQTAPIVAGGGLTGSAQTLQLTHAGNAIPRLFGFVGTQAALRTSTALDVGGVISMFGELALTAGGAITQSTGNITVGRLSASAGGAIELTREGLHPNLVWKVGDLDGTGIDLVSARDVVVEGTVDGGAGDVTLRRATQLTLATGSQVRGRDVHLVTAGAFANAAGPAAIDASSRWLVYSATSAGTTFGGLDSHAAPRWNATYASVPPASVTGSRYLFAEQPQATLTVGDLGKAAGDDAQAQVAAVPTVVGGLRPAVAGAYLAGPAFTGTPVGSSPGAAPGAAAGTYAIAVAGVTAVDGYALTVVPGTLTVAPAPVDQPGTPPVAPTPTPTPGDQPGTLPGAPALVVQPTTESAVGAGPPAAPATPVANAPRRSGAPGGAPRGAPGGTTVQPPRCTAARTALTQAATRLRADRKTAAKRAAQARKAKAGARAAARLRSTRAKKAVQLAERAQASAQRQVRSACA